LSPLTRKAAVLRVKRNKTGKEVEKKKRRTTATTRRRTKVALRYRRGTRAKGLRRKPRWPLLGSRPRSD
jgi:hypothetical protein